MIERPLSKLAYVRKGHAPAFGERPLPGSGILMTAFRRPIRGEDGLLGAHSGHSRLRRPHGCYQSRSVDQCDYKITLGLPLLPLN